MWTSLLLCLLAGFAVADNGFKSGREYEYHWRGRTLTSHDEVTNQNSGILVKSKVIVQAKGSNTLIIKLVQPQYASVHTNLPGGWETDIPEEKLSYKPLPLSGKAVVAKIHDGVVNSFASPKEMRTWESNIYKALVSQLQLDTQGENKIHKSNSNRISTPNVEKMVYKTMEAEVAGKCQVQYDISVLPEYIVQSQPELVPVAQQEDNEQQQHLEITKTTNFSNCEKRPGYHFGLTEFSEGQPGQTLTGEFLSRSSVSRTIISGNLNDYVIQSSVKISQTAASPALYDQQKSTVTSKSNITLVAVHQISSSINEPENLEETPDLTYDYNEAFPEHESSTRYSQGRREYNANDEYSNSAQRSQEDERYSSNQLNDEGYPRRARSIRNERNSNEGQENEWMSRMEMKRRSNDPAMAHILARRASSSSSESDQVEDRLYSRKMKQIGDDDISSQNRFARRTSKESDSSSDSSQSDEAASVNEKFQDLPTMGHPPQTPLNPLFVGYEGRSIQASSQVNLVASAKKLAQSIALELENPNSIPEKNTLEKFNIQAKLVRVMNVAQLQECTQELHASPSSPKDKKFAWKAFRDAVAAAGTGPALTIISEWIKERKLEGEAAAEVLAYLPQTARQPTNEYLKKFRQIVESIEAEQRNLLYVPALNSYSELLRKTVVNPSTAHKRFPVHSFGFMGAMNDEPAKEFVSYLTQKLHQAVDSEDSVKIQIYATALGKIAHPKILDAFEPYLEGQKNVSTFQRLLMVSALSDMTKVHPELARKVLLSVLQNKGETHEVRCAAVYLIMKTVPPTSVLQGMAASTRFEQNPHVKSAIESVILSAASLKRQGIHLLKKRAQAVLSLLDDTDDLSLHLSREYLRSYIYEKYNLAYKQRLAWIGSSDSIIPSSLFYELIQNIGGLKLKAIKAHVMTSSVDNLIELLNHQFNDEQSSGSSRRGDDQFSPRRIAELLNARPSDSEPVEGNIAIKLLGGNRFFAYDSKTIRNIPQVAKAIANVLQSGHDMHYSKFYNQFSITIAHPSCMGLPVYFSVKKPTLLSVTGHVQGATSGSARGPSNVPEEISANADMKFVFASQITSKVGFFLPFENKAYYAGLDKLDYVHVPIKADLKVESRKSLLEATIQPPSAEIHVLHSHTRPFTTEHNILNLIPLIEDRNTKPVQARNPQPREEVYGEESTGFAFRVKYISEKLNPELMPMSRKSERQVAISIFNSIFNDRNTQWSDLSVYFDGQRSRSNSITLSAKYENENENESEGSDDQTPSSNERAESQSQSGDWALPSADSSSPSPMSSQRQRELLTKVKRNIRDASAGVLDTAVTINEGQSGQGRSFVATVAYASSEVDPKSRVLVFLAKNPRSSSGADFQVCMSAQSSSPYVPELNAAQAISFDAQSTIQAAIKYGQSCQSDHSVDITVKQRQSAERKQYVNQSPYVKQCQQQIQEGQNLLPACQNATILANYLDHTTFTVKYNEVPEGVKKVAYHAYELAKYLGYPYLDEDAINVNNPQGQISGEVKFSADLNDVYVSLETPQTTAHFNKIHVPQELKPALVPHLQYNAWEMLWQDQLAMQYNPQCTLEGQVLNTFDNQTYSAQLDNCWYVLMTNQPQDNEYSDDDAIAVLAKNVGSEHKVIKVSLENTVIEMIPKAVDNQNSQSSSESSVNVYVNQKPIQVSSRRVSYAQPRNNQDEDEVWVYALPDEAVVVKVPEYGVQIVTDGKRIELQASNKYRSDIMGLCGTFDGEPETDFTNPQNCILRNPQDFVQSYTVSDGSSGSCSSANREVSGRCVQKEILYTNVISQTDSEYYQQRSRFAPRPRPTSCTVHERKIITEEGQICFSKDRMPSCTRRCKPSGESLKEIEFYCANDSPAARSLAQKVRRNYDVNLSQQTTSMKRELYLPKTCIPE